jgi:two-component system sensor histidine kinase DesK
VTSGNDGKRWVASGDDGAATVEIVDDGKGPPSLPMFRPDTGPGSGLTGLAERVRSVGGHLEAGRLAGGGFRLVASVPMQADARGRA